MQDLLVDCNPPIKSPIAIPNIQKNILLSVIKINEQMEISDRRQTMMNNREKIRANKSRIFG